MLEVVGAWLELEVIGGVVRVRGNRRRGLSEV